MKEVERKLIILYVIREALANINLESEFNIELDKEMIEELESKILKRSLYEKLE